MKKVRGQRYFSEECGHYHYIHDIEFDLVHNGLTPFNNDLNLELLLIELEKQGIPVNHQYLYLEYGLSDDEIRFALNNAIEELQDFIKLEPPLIETRNALCLIGIHNFEWHVASVTIQHAQFLHPDGTLMHFNWACLVTVWETEWCSRCGVGRTGGSSRSTTFDGC